MLLAAVSRQKALTPKMRFWYLWIRLKETNLAKMSKYSILAKFVSLRRIHRYQNRIFGVDAFCLETADWNVIFLAGLFCFIVHRDGVSLPHYPP